MKVFISWSGDRSRAVADALVDWLPDVINAIEPWMAKNDIERGEEWRRVLHDALGEQSIGIICLTPENLESLWIHYEAGALSIKKNALVCTLLWEVNGKRLKRPLSDFQATKCDKEEIRQLIHTINRRLPDRRPDDRLNKAFDRLWPELQRRLTEVPKLDFAAKSARYDSEFFDEMIERLQEMKYRVTADPQLSKLATDPEEQQDYIRRLRSMKATSILREQDEEQSDEDPNH